MKNLILILLLSFPKLLLGQNVSLEDIWLTSKYRAEYFQELSWTPDGKFITEFYQASPDSIPQILAVSTEFKLKGNFLEKMVSMPKDFNVSNYTFSDDQRFILFSTDEESIYRRSSKANYYLFEISTGSLRQVHDFNKGKISYATLSPDASSIAFVRDNNIFYCDIKNLIETPVTTDGKFNFIINGATDWVYEEEFEFAQGFFWSPDSKKIAYYRFNETEVKQYTMQVWGGNYPENYTYKYPKAGETNANVSLYFFSLESKNTLLIDSTTKGDKEYFPRMQWTGNPNIISYYRMNRLQNKLEIVHYNCTTNTLKIVYSEQDKAYVEVTNNHIYLPQSENFIFTSEQSGFRHLYYQDVTNNRSNPLTTGDFEVVEILGYQEQTGKIFFTAHNPTPLVINLFITALGGKSLEKMTSGPGSHQVSFSPDFNFYVDIVSTINTPPSASLFETATNTFLFDFGKNEPLKSKIANSNCSDISFFTFNTTQKIDLNGWILKPKNFSPKKKYPVLVTVYGGPGIQEAVDEWQGPNYFWYQHLAGQGYIVVCIDGRGTGGRGAAFKKCTQFNLGKFETEDVIEIAKHLKSLKFIDDKRIGIFGWSFGGYLSTLAITKGSDHYKAAIAVAPVTNWRFYDNIYTERYMGLPKDNPKGYDENAPAYFAKDLKGNYLLIHGTADDNVHIQNSLEMQRALIDANKQFELFYYPDKNHSIYGGNTRFHLYKLMTEFILRKL